MNTTVFRDFGGQLGLEVQLEIDGHHTTADRTTREEARIRPRALEQEQVAGVEPDAVKELLAA